MLAARTHSPWSNRSSLSRLLLTGLALFLLPLALQAAPTPLDAAASQGGVEAQARAAQKDGHWFEACRLYEELIHGKEKPTAGVREAYQECLRRYYLQRRHSDKLYRDAIARLSPTPDAALKIYDQVLEALTKKYFDPQKVEMTSLFKNGVQELLFALDDEFFTRDYLTNGDKKGLDPLRAQLNQLRDKKVGTATGAHDEIINLARLASGLGLGGNTKRVVVVFALEFACGACNSLDDYSLFLTPYHLNAYRGKYVGVGVDLAIIGQSLEIARVYPNSPAAESGLLPGDRVLNIDSQPVEKLPPDVVAERLLGDPDTQIELEIARGQMKPTVVTLVRRMVATPSVEYSMYRMMGDMTAGSQDVGYIRIYSFQDTTTQEVKEALARLQTAGMKALILDLRGNPGGVFKASVQVSELFLGEGAVIVFTQGQLKEFNRPYKVEGGNPFQAPMAVLIDGDTASSAEILAGALKEHERARLFGQPTFGKGTIQQVIPLDRSAGGIRITVAKFTSPLKNPVSGVGVLPHVEIPDAQDPLARAAEELWLLLGKMPVPSLVMGPGSIPPG